MKKIFMLFLVFAVFLVSCNPLCSYGADNILADNTISSNPNNLVSVLTETDLEGKTGNITRGEFLKILISLISNEIAGASSKVIFDDVDVMDTELSYAVEYAVNSGIISVDSKFRSNEDILYYEAIKMCCTVLGYTYVCEQRGGYPTGYAVTAELNGVLNNVSYTDGYGVVSYSDALLMFHNMLNAPYMQEIYYKDGSVGYASSNNTLLYTLYDIYEVKGIVNANDFTVIGDENIDLESCQIHIDGIAYDTDLDINSWLGYEVKAYVKDVKNEKKIVAVENYSTEVASVKLGELYWNDEKNRLEDNKGNKYSVDKSLSVIYNGRYTSHSLKSYIGNNSATAKLIDNTNDGVFDVAVISQADYMRIKVISPVEGCIYGENGKKIQIDDDMFWEIYDLSSYGAEKPGLSDLRMDMVIAYEQSYDSSVVKIYSGLSEVKGIAKSVNTQNRITVGEEDYECSQYFINNYLSSLSLGKEYTFVIGICGELAELTTKKASNEYGYIVDAALSNKAFSKTVQLKLFTESDEVICSDVAEKVILNGERTDDTDKILNTLRAAADEGFEFCQLIKYSLNSEDKISHIDTAQTGNEFYNDNKDKEFDSLKKYNFAATYRYRNVGTLFYPYFNIKTSKVFVVPADRTREKDYQITTSDYFQDGTYAITPYDVPSTGTAGAVVYVSSAASGLTTPISTTPCMVVEEVRMSLDSEGMECRKVSGWCNGEFKEYYIENDVDIVMNSGRTELKTGDVMMLAVGSDTITDVMPIYDIAEREFQNADYAYKEWQSVSFLDGKVYNAADGYISYTNTKDADGNYDYSIENINHISASTKNVVEVNLSTGLLKASSVDNLLGYVNAGDDCDYFILQYHYLNGQLLTIYKFD